MLLDLINLYSFVQVNMQCISQNILSVTDFVFKHFFPVTEYRIGT